MKIKVMIGGSVCSGRKAGTWEDEAHAVHVVT